MVRFCPNAQVPLPSRLNCSIGRPERPTTDAVSTVLSAVAERRQGGERALPPARGRLRRAVVVVVIAPIVVIAIVVVVMFSA